MSLTLLFSSYCNKDKNKYSDHLEVHLNCLLIKSKVKEIGLFRMVQNFVNSKCNKKLRKHKLTWGKLSLELLATIFWLHRHSRIKIGIYRANTQPRTNIMYHCYDMISVHSVGFRYMNLKVSHFFLYNCNDLVLPLPLNCGCYSISFSCSPSSIDLIYVFKFVLH